ncbi:MAG: DNA mismatch repair protein MutS [Sphingobacteriales bacterium]|nr:DNA mismatch repair protein MutS [Sphingobacteriales bacterium]
MAKKADGSETPLMKQYLDIKGKYPGAILLFRVGDFYETFGEDAVKTAQILGIVLTKRANGAASHIELAGFPHHSLDTYLPKLVRAGQRVAICDQLEDPKLTKKIVKRGVTELITPGLSYNDKILDNRSNNYLAAVFLQDDKGGIAFLDISTGEFMLTEGPIAYLDKLLQSLKPSETLVSKKQLPQFKQLFGDKWYTYTLDEWNFQYTFASDKLLAHFQTQSLKGFGIQDLQLGIISAGVCLHYLSETHHHQIAHIVSVSRINEEKYVWLDRFTIRNLELLFSAHENGVPLIQVLDTTVTPMGARLLKRWMVMPLKDLVLIQERLHIVDQAKQLKVLRKKMRETLAQVGDLERLISKLAMRRIGPRELQQLNRSLKLMPIIQGILDEAKEPQLAHLAKQIHLCTWVVEKLDTMLVAEPPVLANKGNILNEGVNAELDELRKIAFGGKDYLLQLQKKEQERTGIPSLKIAYNNVFGYYLEVTHVHKDKVPADWMRKQTLTNAERYITEELKKYEDQILGAEEKISAIEESLYNELVTSLAEEITPIQSNAQLIGKIDCLFSFAQLAEQNNYCKPELHAGFELSLKDARHPVIEKQLPLGEPYIANDVFLDKDTQQIIILTGPNMSGKSAILRQTALCVLMAQMGSFVPAKEAKIGIVDKVFTRVGASDNLSSGESTFMVEMTETASILNNLSPNSLILLDEIGRGTSTYDGISLAWAITEYLNQHPYKPKTLFATHYHELNELEQADNGIKNFHVRVKEQDNKVLFLRKLKPGGSEHSFGIHVARMAGIPKTVLNRSDILLKELEKGRENISGKEIGRVKVNPIQLSMFQLNDPVLIAIKEQLATLDLNTLSPIEALLKLNELKKLFEQ